MAEFYKNVRDATKEKEEAGFATQITDVWSLALTDHCQYKSPCCGRAELTLSPPNSISGALEIR
jgi:hypothetical protein